MNPLDEVGAVADAVLFEGYLLYPYRASAQKNRLRWQFGVLTPSSDGTEPTRSRTEVLLEPKPDCRLRIRLPKVRRQAQGKRRRLFVDHRSEDPIQSEMPRRWIGLSRCRSSRRRLGLDQSKNGREILVRRLLESLDVAGKDSARRARARSGLRPERR